MEDGLVSGSLDKGLPGWESYTGLLLQGKPRWGGNQETVSPLGVISVMGKSPPKGWCSLSSFNKYLLHTCVSHTVLGGASQHKDLGPQGA